MSNKDVEQFKADMLHLIRDKKITIKMNKISFIESVLVVYSQVKDNGEEQWEISLGSRINGRLVTAIEYDDGKYEEGTAQHTITTYDENNQVINSFIGMPCEVYYRHETIPTTTHQASMKAKISLARLNKLLRVWYLYYGGKEVLDGTKAE